MQTTLVVTNSLIVCALLILCSLGQRNIKYNTDEILDVKQIEPYMFTQIITGHLNILIPTQQKLDQNGNLLSQEYTIEMVRGQQQLLPSKVFNASQMFLYSGQTVNGQIASYPGPAIIAKKNVPITVRWRNQIQGKHFLPVDYSQPFKSTKIFRDQVPVVPHAHGIATKTQSDGEPQNYWAYSGNKSLSYKTVKDCGTNQAIYFYPNQQDAGNNWYHDHTIGITRLNVYAGLAGFYKIIQTEVQNEFEKRIIERHGKEVAEEQTKYLIVSEKSFKKNGQLFYPSETQVPHFTSWVPEFFGNTILVNGKVWPKMELTKGKHRFVLLNACQNRFLNLNFKYLSRKLPVELIRVDSTYYDQQMVVTEFMATISSRIQFILDLSNVKGQVIIENNADAPYPDGDPENLIPQFTGKVLKIDVKSHLHQSLDEERIKIQQPIKESKSQINKFPFFQEGQKVFPTLFQVDQDDQPVAMFIDGILMQNGRQCENHTFKIGKTYDFHIINLTPDSHPIHFHLINFQKVKTYMIDVEKYTQKYFEINGQPTRKGWSKPPIALDPEQFRTMPDITPVFYQRIFRDTADVHPGMVTVLRMKFAKNDGTPFTSMQLKGQRFVYHCHMLEHEDNEMMRYFCLE